MNDGGNSKNCGVGSGENPIEIIHQGSEEGIFTITEDTELTIKIMVVKRKA